MTGSRFNIRLEDGTSSETSRRSRETRGTMAEFRWIKTSLFLILVLQFTAAATGQRFLSFTVRDGDEVTLPCNSLMDDQEKCNFTEWFFYNSRSRPVVLFIDGKIDDEAKDKSDRLSVSENCSLVIKKVTDEDVGHYTCRQFRSPQTDAQVHLSVVTLTEHKDTEEVTVICSVSSAYEGCRQTVKWLFQGQDVDKDNKEVMTSQSYCSASLKFLTSHFFHTSRFNSLMCEVTDGDKVKKFPLRNSPSGDKRGEDTTTTTIITTEDTTTTIEASKTTSSTISKDSTELQIVWWHVIVAVVLVALLIIIIIVAVIKWKRTKGNTTRTDGNVELTSDPAPETSQDTADPEEGVSYASVSYTKKTDGAAQGRSKHDDEVTYASVNTSSTNPSSLYSTVTIT